MFLKDLNVLAIESKAQRDLYPNTEIRLSDDFKIEFLKRFPHSKIQFYTFTSVDYTPQGLSIVIPNQWFIIASFFAVYLEALFEYKKHCSAFNFTKDQIALFRDNKSVDEGTRQKIQQHFSPEDAELFLKFLTDYDWWFGSKTIDRGDFFVSSVLTLASVVHITQGYIAQLAEKLVGNGDLIALLKSAVDTAIHSLDESPSIKNKFAGWLVEKVENNYFDNDLAKTVRALTDYEERYSSEFSQKLFDVDPENLQGKIQAIKANIWNEEADFWQYSKSKSTHQPRAILGDENYIRFLKEIDVKHTRENTSLKNGYNKIFFGAPGTGKSFLVSKELNGLEDSQVERVIFHPDYDYASFVGGYKPVTEKDGNGEEVVRYKFIPQVFTNIYEKACRNPSKNYYLVIEEINRGNCAEIFGDIFQLLDRNPHYMITPNEDLQKYLQVGDQYSPYSALKFGKMAMPENLIILATMNTSDQSLYPMDSAFKRRWEWEYVPIKYPETPNDKSCASFEYLIQLTDNQAIKWVRFIAIINQHILENPSLGLDKCVGNFFVKPDDGKAISVKALINKVIFYLWNDVFKDEDNDIFVGHTYMEYFPVETKGRERLYELIDKFKLKGLLKAEDFIEITSQGEQLLSVDQS